jgi:hypothetical protein
MAEGGELEEMLEGVVDRAGLSTTLQALAMVCAAKAEFLASNWQDDVSARAWARIEGRLDTVAAAAKREGL